MIKLKLIDFRLTCFVLAIGSLLLAACSENEDANTIDQILYIDGPGNVSPESTAEYTAAEFGGSVTWSVTGNASLGATNGSAVQVNFTGVGTAVLSATGSGYSGSIEIAIDPIGAELSGVSFGTSSTINNGATDDVTFTFAAPLASVPTLALTGDFSSGSITTLTEVGGSNMTKFVATYTGGTGNGQVQGRLTNVTVSDTYGGGTAAEIVANLHTVDNVRPHGKLSVSASNAKTGTALTFTMTLNEAARANGSMVVDVTGAGIGGAPIQVTLAASGDAAVWTGTHTVTGTDEGGLNAVLDVSTVIDAAGNAPTTMDNVVAVTIDNTAPALTQASLAVTPEVGEPRTMNVATAPQETEIMWIWLPSNSQFVPAGPSDFEGEGMGNSKFTVGKGMYKIYFMEVDAAGNESNIVLSDVITVN